MGAYKGNSGGQSISNRIRTQKKQFNNEVTNMTPMKGQGKDKAPAKRKATPKNQKQSKAEMDRQKAEGACFYSEEKGDIANECPKKKVKTNHVRLSEDTDSSEAEYEAESEDTEELNRANSITTFKTTFSQPKDEKRPLQVLEFTIMVNGKPAKALADTGTIGGTLLSNPFITINNMPYEPRKNPVNLKMVVEG